jgi:hypothetical protein
MFRNFFLCVCAYITTFVQNPLRSTLQELPLQSLSISLSLSLSLSISLSLSLSLSLLLGFSICPNATRRVEQRVDIEDRLQHDNVVQR